MCEKKSEMGSFRSRYMCANLRASASDTASNITLLHGSDFDLLYLGQNIIEISTAAGASAAIDSWHLVDLVQRQEPQRDSTERECS